MWSNQLQPEGETMWYTAQSARAVGGSGSLRRDCGWAGNDWRLWSSNTLLCSIPLLPIVFLLILPNPVQYHLFHEVFVILSVKCDICFISLPTCWFASLYGRHHILSPVIRSLFLTLIHTDPLRATGLYATQKQLHIFNVSNIIDNRFA